MYISTKLPECTRDHALPVINSGVHRRSYAYTREQFVDTCMGPDACTTRPKKSKICRRFYACTYAKFVETCTWPHVCTTQVRGHRLDIIANWAKVVCGYRRWGSGAFLSRVLIFYFSASCERLRWICGIYLSAYTGDSTCPSFLPVCIAISDANWPPVHTQKFVSSRDES